MTCLCRACGSPSGDPIFSAEIFDKNVEYYECKICAYVQTQDPTWLEQAYQTPINNCDTGIMLRNQLNVGMVLGTLASIGNLKGCVVDCAGGYGILVRLLRDRGVEALWSDPFCKNLLSVGFEHQHEKADLVTAFEALEHFEDPLAELESLLSVAPNLLVSTEIIPSPTPKPDQWWYYGLDHGQHIGFFRIKTLELLARKFGKHLITDGQRYHLFTQQKLQPSRWRLYTRLGRRLPFLFTSRLQPKVLSDFAKMSRIK